MQKNHKLSKVHIYFIYIYIYKKYSTMLDKDMRKDKKREMEKLENIN